MTSESSPIRVRPLADVLDGAYWVEFIHRLLDVGYDRFYVKVPEGFQVSLSNPETSTLGPSWHVGDVRKVRYLQLDRYQLNKLLEYPPLALHHFKAGCLTSGLRPDGIPSIDFRYEDGSGGSLEPVGAAVASSVPMRSSADSDTNGVVKSVDHPGGICSYILQGISFKDIFIEEPACSDALENKAPPADVVLAPAKEDIPDDPYGLKETSPLVFEILRKAHGNRGKARGEIDPSSLAAEFRKLNAAFEKNPKPFNDGRHKLAANLANPNYKYSSDGARRIPPPENPVSVPADAFFDQDFINETFKKVLYAACLWGGVMEPKLEGSYKRLVDVLVGMGFFDADDSDQVQGLIFFIAGRKCRRNKDGGEFRHERESRD